MKGKLFAKIQALGQQAARFQQAPGKVGQIAQAITLTSHQLLDLKSGLRSTFEQLKAEGEEPLLRVVQEIHEARDTLGEAGFELVGLDLELNPAPRVQLRLKPIHDADPDVVKRLVEAHPERRQLNGILTALVRSTQIAEKIQLGDLQHREVCVGIGPIPGLRLSWRLASASASASAPATDAPPVLAHFAVPPPPPNLEPSIPISVLGNTPPGGFFAPRAVPTPRVPFGPTASAEPPAESTRKPEPEPEPEPTPAAPPTAPWASNALDRFKKMPNLGRKP